MEVEKQIIASQKSWLLESDQVRLAVTELGGHMAPVTFFRDSDPVEPYYVNPWHAEGISPEPPVLVPLRGDFFCMPFGADSTVEGVAHTTHGEPATGLWSLARGEATDRGSVLELTMETRKLPGTITKRILLLPGQNVLYISHRLEGYSVRTTLGHHATLAPPPEEGAMRISTSPIRFGLTDPGSAAHLEGEYNALLEGEQFESLRKVPSRWKDRPELDCTAFPAREGFCDILQVYAEDGDGPAWTAAAVPSRGYLWFSLKDPAVLPGTVFWMENHGRHGMPWNGRNLCIGLEETCSFLATGLADSTRDNPASSRGVPTAYTLRPDQPLLVNTIHGVVRIPSGFDRVADIRFDDGEIELTAESGETVRTVVDHRFIATGEAGL